MNSTGSLGKDQVALMEMLGLEASDYHSFWFYLGNADEVDSRSMEESPILRAKNGEGEERFFIRFCRKHDPSHQIILRIFEKKVYEGMIPLMPKRGGFSKWHVDVWECPEASRFQKEIKVPLIEACSATISASLDLSKSLYASKHPTAVPLDAFLKMIVGRQQVPLDDDPSEIYVLWRRFMGRSENKDRFSAEASRAIRGLKS